MENTEKKNIENRKYIRIPQYIDVDYSIVQTTDNKLVNEETVYEGFIENISKGGVLLAVDRKFQIGQLLELTIKIHKPIKSIDLYGKVVRIEDMGEGIFELGIVFTKYMAIDKELLEQFLGEVIK